MTKQEQFLYIVQTAMLADAVNLASDPKTRGKYRHELSASGVLGRMNDVTFASEHIPESMSALEAAHDFCSCFSENLRYLEVKAGKAMRLPA